MKACQILALLVLVQHLVDSYYVHRGRLVANNGHTVYTVSDATHIKRPVRRTGTALLFSLTGSAPSSGPSADNPASHNRHRNVNQYRTNGERLLQMERILSYCKGETDGLKAMPTLTEVSVVTMDHSHVCGCSYLPLPFVVTYITDKSRDNHGGPSPPCRRRTEDLQGHPPARLHTGSHVI